MSDEVAPKVHALPKPQVDAKILDEMAAMLADVAEPIKGGLLIRVREMRAQLEKAIGLLDFLT